MKIKALLLFSEGLDSILAAKILQNQGIEIYALRFITPFFGWKWKNKEEIFEDWVKENWGFSGRVVDITPSFIEVLNSPSHGYGKGLNPCIDCRILMLKKAKNFMKELQAHFLVTGEVIGQRPMTQRKDIMRHIEKEAQVQGLLLRPLSALRLPPTIPEIQGWVKRKALLGLVGRGRKKQIELAKALGIKNIPSPAGGCLLTDPNIALRGHKFLSWKGALTPREAELLVLGRHFPLSSSWLILGREEKENTVIFKLHAPQDILLKLKDIPGPTGLLLGSPVKEDLEQAFFLLKKYAPKSRGKEKIEIIKEQAGKKERILLDDSALSAN